MLKKRNLGKSNLKISQLSLGCMSLPSEKKEAAYVIEAALDAGINYFDTADLYHLGVNEEIVGELLKSHRQNLLIATKVGNRWVDGQDGWTWDASPSYIKQAVKNSLRRLQTDYIDVYQLHGGTQADHWPEIIETFEELKRDGVIREYGISSIRPNVFIPFAEKSQAISNMMQFNLLDQRAGEWFDMLESQGLSVVTRGSIAKGLLTNEWRTRLQDYMSYPKQQLVDVLTQLEETCGDVHAAALAFNLHYPTVASTVIGARTKEQLQQNLRAYEKAQQLSNVDEMLTFTRQDRYTEHR
ncbi:MAG: aldo/keto reductase [Solibacillus sp.]